MDASPDQLSFQDRYKLLTGLIVPRPIAWVSSISPAGIPNLAPFSYFAIVGHAPMAVSISVTGRKPDGNLKDTWRNLLPAEKGGSGEFCINIVSENLAAEMNLTSRPLPNGESEFDLAGLGMEPSRSISAPGVVGSSARFECRTIHTIEVGTARLFGAEIIHLWVRDGVIDEKRRIDFEALATIGRLAGTQYCRTQDRFELPSEGYFPQAS